jgi:hypothetical protein
MLNYPEGIRSMMMIMVERCLVLDEYGDDDRTRNAYRKSRDVYNRVKLIPDEIAVGGREIISQHAACFANIMPPKNNAFLGVLMAGSDLHRTIMIEKGQS